MCYPRQNSPIIPKYVSMLVGLTFVRKVFLDLIKNLKIGYSIFWFTVQLFFFFKFIHWQSMVLIWDVFSSHEIPIPQHYDFDAPTTQFKSNRNILIIFHNLEEDD